MKTLRVTPGTSSSEGTSLTLFYVVLVVYTARCCVVVIKFQDEVGQVRY